MHERLDRYDRKRYKGKRKNLRENLNVGKKVLVLAERIRKKSALGKFYKLSVQNIPYFNKEQTFVITNRQKIVKTKVPDEKISEKRNFCCCE